MVSDKNISVVVQGAIEKELTYKCLLSVRKYLPGAEIVLSTWKGSDVSCLSGLYDILVLNANPGGFLFNASTGQINNNNRMVLSTQEGLKRSRRKYTLKLRSDLVLKNNNILKYTNDNYARIKWYKLFKQRVVANNIFTFKFEAGEHGVRHYRPFHVSDWWFFGLTEDLRLLFDIPLGDEPELSQYFLMRNMPESKYHRFPDAKWRFSPEQYVQVECVRKHFKDIKFEHILDYDEINIKQSEIFIVNNYIILSPQHSGIYPEKSRYKHYDYRKDLTVCDGIYTEQMWLCDYQRYCCSDYKMPFGCNWKETFKVNRYVDKLKKHCDNFVRPLKSILRRVHKFAEWLCEPFSILYYAVKILLRVVVRFRRFFR